MSDVTTLQYLDALSDEQVAFIQETVAAYAAGRKSAQQIAEKESELARVQAELADINDGIEQIRCLIDGA